MKVKQVMAIFWDVGQGLWHQFGWYDTVRYGNSMNSSGKQTYNKTPEQQLASNQICHWYLKFCNFCYEYPHLPTTLLQILNIGGEIPFFSTFSNYGLVMSHSFRDSLEFWIVGTRKNNEKNIWKLTWLAGKSPNFPIGNTTSTHSWWIFQPVMLNFQGDK